VCPSVHGNIILVRLEGKVELLPIMDDIDSDEKVSRLELVLSKERVEVVGWLQEHAKIGIRPEIRNRSDSPEEDRRRIR
jgi:hypothetical protein